MLPRTLQINNGSSAISTFSSDEMKRRLVLLRELMHEQQLDAVLMTSYHNINYYGDFLYCAFGRPYGLLITLSSFTLISANIDGGQPARRTQGKNVVYTDWQQDNYYHALAKLMQGKSSIGLEFDHISVQNFEKIKQALPSYTIKDVGVIAMKLRMIKSSEEISHIHKMTKIADLGGEACVEAIDIGVPEYVVAQHATNIMIKEIAHTFPESELRDTWTWFQSGINTDGAHNPVTTRKISRGDILSLNCFPMVAGYYVALERTLFAKEVSDAHLRLWEINCQVHDEGKRLIKPGARCSDIAHALNEIYAEHDLLPYRTFGYGHSFGVLSHYYGREAGLELREDVDTILVPGMVVSMEPMIMLPEGEPGAGGYREHDILVIQDDGAHNITAFPYGPEFNIVV